VAWLDLPQLIVYLAGLLGCSVLAWRLMTGCIAEDRVRQVGWALCPAAFFGGIVITAFTTPDWNPIAILWLFLPYFAFAVWALYFSLLLGRGRDTWSAGRRALAWTIPSLLLAPLLIALGLLLLQAL
jgi:hypothetical protein